MVDLRARRQCGLDPVLVDINRQKVLDAGLMSAEQFDTTPVERRRILSVWLDELLAVLDW
jgi:hypothetical protein